MKTSITFEVDTDNLASFTDAHIVQLWHIAQADPAPYAELKACWYAECVGREIIQRWLIGTPPELWHHQGMHMLDAAEARRD